MGIFGRVLAQIGGIVRNWQIVAGITAVTATGVFGVLPAVAAKTPSQIGYPIKRFEESIAAAVAPTSNLKTNLQLDFAQRRLNEAALVATEAHQNDTDSTKTAQTINQLLASFQTTYQNQNAKINQELNQNQKPAASVLKSLRQKTVTAYTAIQLLRVQAPDASQLNILIGIDTVQQQLAALGDLIGATPLTASDLSHLSQLISAGVLSKDQVNSLINNATSNRALHTQLKELINSDVLPSDMVYTLTQDTVKQIAPDKAGAFEAVAEFGQMQRISATIQASRPTAAQRQAIQAYLKSYKAGEPLPNNDTRPFLAPIVYGLFLTGQLQSNLPNLNTVTMWGDKQALFDNWKGTLASDQKNLAQLYQKLMTQAENQPTLHTNSLARVQSELVGAAKANVAYLVMPPGWGASTLPELSQQMGIELAGARFIESNPNTNEQLARLEQTQAALQTTLDAVKQTNTAITTKLETQVNTFSGSKEQTTTLKDTLTSFKETQLKTVNELQSQLTTISQARTTLEKSIETIRQEQLVNVTELELRAASNAKTLSETVKTELTTQLATINKQNQTIVSELQTKVDGLGTDQGTLRDQLNTSLLVIRDNQDELTAYVQAQIDSGKAAADTLQTDLQTIQNTLTQQQTAITNVSAGADALTTLINTVTTSSDNQANQLQSQIDALTVDQKAVQDSITTLKTEQAAELTQVTDQVSALSVLQTEAEVALNQLSAQQTAAQTTVSQLTSDYTALQSALTTNEQAYTALQAEVAAQQSELATWQDQSNAAIDQINHQQTALAGQINAISSDTAQLAQTVESIQTSASTTQTQLDELLANPPWATIPAGTYVDQSQFDALQADLNAQFAQKSAELDAQFQTYQQQVNAEVTQLENTVTTTIAQQAQLEQTVNELRTQVEALQAQLEAAAPTDTTSPEPAL